MGKKAALAIVGTGGAAASAATAASSLDQHADDYLEEDNTTTDDVQEQVTEQPQQPASSDTGTQNSVQPTQTETQTSQPQAAANTGLGNWLTTHTTNGNKTTYFGTNMAFENATFDQTGAQENLNNTTPDYFGNFNTKYSSGDWAKIKSNLRVTRKKWSCNSNQWGGELTWFWSFENKQTNKGFITVNTLKTNKDKKKLVLSGIFYILEKDGSQWKVKHKKEVKETDNKTLDASNFNHYFPKPYWYTKRGRFDELYYNNWDFMSDTSKLNSLCDQPSTTTPDTRIGEWEYKSSAWWQTHWGWWGFEWYNRVDDWTGNLNWFPYMYGNTFKLEDNIGSFKLGTWYPKGTWFLNRNS